MLFAYTIKGWGLPFAGDPLNHSALLTDDQIDALRRASSASTPDDAWARFAPDSPEGRLCASRGRAAARARRPRAARALGRPTRSRRARRPDRGRDAATQEAFGDTLAELARVPGRRRRGS